MRHAIKTMLALFAVPAEGWAHAEQTSQATTNSVVFRLVEHKQDPGFRSPPRSRHSPPRPARFYPLNDAHHGFGLRPAMLSKVWEAEFRHGLPRGLLDALIATESAYRPLAVSAAGAAGLAQLMPQTAAELGVLNRFDPVQSIEGGARYLKSMLNRFGSVGLALAAYNAGPRAVERARGTPSNAETILYVRRVLARWRGLS